MRLFFSRPGFRTEALMDIGELQAKINSQVEHCNYLDRELDKRLGCYGDDINVVREVYAQRWLIESDRYVLSRMQCMTDELKSLSDFRKS